MKRSMNKILFAAAIFVFSACTKEDTSTPPDIIYTVDVDGYTATFDNQTTGAESFRWEFGDGATSTEKSPVHTYAGKGKYVPTLYVTTPDNKVLEGSTVLRISKGSAVDLKDNSLSDWDTVTHNVVQIDPTAGIFRAAKFDYDGNNIYVYFEMASAKANGDIFDFYLDSDNNPATGLITWLFPGSGNDVLIEGAMLNDWFDVFYHRGEQTAFSFDLQSISEFYEIGTVEESGGILKFEARLSRSKIKGLQGTGFKIGVTATKSDWSAILGAMPGTGVPAFYLDTSE